MTPDYNLYSDHYYDKQRHAVHFYANHDMRMEMKLWQELHQAGLINLFMRQWAQTDKHYTLYVVFFTVRAEKTVRHVQDEPVILP